MGLMSENKEISALFTLLDDNPEIANSALQRLLNYPLEDLSPFLAESREQGSDLFRKRLHQLESILTIRERRKLFLRNLEDGKFDFATGLAEVHLLWYDNDSLPELLRLEEEFFAAADKYAIETLPLMAYYLPKNKYRAIPEGELNADYYCIGSVLEDKIGIDFIFCGLICELGRRHNLKLRMCRQIGRWAVVDEERKNILIPAEDWQIMGYTSAEDMQFYELKHILKLAALNLFLSAVSSDSFRYIYTIGSAISGRAEDEKLDFLPYPYGGEKKNE